ncbi:MAG: hypothetical protein WBV36_11080 [Terriglobales bacterium]
MYYAHRFVSAAILTIGLLAFGPMATAATPQEAAVQVRVYDSGHHDYHNWDDREAQAYRRYLTERHENYRAYEKQSHKRQHDYWNWRHSHREHD